MILSKLVMYLEITNKKFIMKGPEMTSEFHRDSDGTSMSAHRCCSQVLWALCPKLTDAS